MTLSDVQQALYEVLLYFVERQALVEEALRDLRPDLLDDGPIDDDAPVFAEWGEWIFAVQGEVATLNHRSTHEPLQWEPPDLGTFDRSAFAAFLLWFLHTAEEGNDFADRIAVYLEQTGLTPQAFVFQTLEQFHREGLLSAQFYNSYTLV